MSRVHTIPLHLGDLQQSTAHMSAAEFGAYFRLLVCHYNVGEEGLPDSDSALARMAGVTPREWKLLAPIVMRKFEKKSGFRVHKRVLKTLETISAKSEVAKANRLKRQHTASTDVPTESVRTYNGGTTDQPTNHNPLSIKPEELDKSNSSLFGEKMETEKPKKEKTNGAETKRSFRKVFGEFTGPRVDQPPTIPNDFWAAGSESLGDPDRIEIEWGKFARHHDAKGNRFVRWGQAWANWLSTARGNRSTSQFGNNSEPGKFATLCREVVADSQKRSGMGSGEAPSWLQERDQRVDRGDLPTVG